MQPDPSVYLVLGPDVADPCALAREAVAGGVTMIQWRDKTAAPEDEVLLVRQLVAAVDVPVLVNDKPEIARASGAAGVHVGHGDAHAWAARKIVGENAIVGVTIHTVEEAKAVDGAPITYASVGGVFETTSKVNDHSPIGIDGFCEIAARLRMARPVPVIAIAGITVDRAETLARAGADGVAVMSAITRAPSPRDAAAGLSDALRRGKEVSR
ncbi:MAG: thiamine phosphate synthase [Pseudomonadota bacterium]